MKTCETCGNAMQRRPREAHWQFDNHCPHRTYARGHIDDTGDTIIYCHDCGLIHGGGTQ